MARASPSDEDLEVFFPDEEEEHSCSSPDLHVEQVSDCECSLTQAPTESSICLTVSRQTGSMLRRSNPKDGIHIRRIKSYRKKIYTRIESISDLVEDIPEPDGIDELRRRQQRVVEFLAWICRNYHFILHKQIYVIKKQTKKPCIGARYTFFNAVCEKLVFAHQTAAQALQAYERHLPTTVGTGVHSKLREMLRYVIDLCQLNNKLGIIYTDAETDDIIESRSRCLLKKLQMKKLYDIDALGTCTSVSQSKKPTTGTNSKIDLSMYEAKPRMSKCSGKCRKKAVVHAKAKAPKTKSKTKTVQRICTFTNVSEQGSSENSKGPSLTSKAALDEPVRQKKCLVRKKSIPTSVSLFDNVKTMMDFIPNDQSESEETMNQPSKLKVAEGVMKENVIETLIGLAETVRSQLDQGKQVLESKPGIEEIIASSKTATKRGKLTAVDIDSLNQINELMQQLEEVLPKKSLSSTKTLGELESSSSNARLIIIEHESSEESLHEKESVASSSSTLIQVEKVDTTVLSTDAEVKIPNNWEPCRRKTEMIISTVPDPISTLQPVFDGISKPSVVTLMVSDAHKQSFMEYKNMFASYACKRRMYDEQKKPWEIMTRVADHLIDNILEDLVANEIGMHQVAENLVELEFK